MSTPSKPRPTTFWHTLSRFLRWASWILGGLVFAWIVIWAWDGWGTLPEYLNSRIPEDAFEPTAALLQLIIPALGVLATWWGSRYTSEQAKRHSTIDQHGQTVERDQYNAAGDIIINQPTTIPAPQNDRERRNRERMLQKVRQFWVEGVLRPAWQPVRVQSWQR